MKKSQICSALHFVEEQQVCQIGVPVFVTFVSEKN